jgi:hypothetical protein
MSPKIFKLLVIGIALLILGPVLGLVFSMLGTFQTPQATPAGTLPDVTRVTARLTSALLPLTIGIVLGAVGAFLTVLALITHRFRPRRPGPEKHSYGTSRQSGP